MIKEINHINELSQLVQHGFTDWSSLGEVSVKQNKDFLIFNYNENAEYQNRWNFFERISRGLIVHAKTGEIVARSFDKFFNWRAEQHFSHAPIVRVMEKLDGSLGILYRQQEGYAIATRGDLNNPQTKWANQKIQHFDLADLPLEYTLIFELIYPKNRIIVDYGQREELVLLAIRNRFTGAYLAWEQVNEIAQKYGFSLPLCYQFNQVEDILTHTQILDGNAEGYIVEFADGQFFKFKGQRYVELAQMEIGLSFKSVVEAVYHDRLETLRAKMPEEFLAQIDRWVEEIQQISSQIYNQAQAAFEIAPKATKKEFATWVMQHHRDLSNYLFCLWDGKDLRQVIYLKAF